MIVAGAAITIIVNGVYLQHGPHPAPIFAIKPLPVAPSRESVGSVQRQHAIQHGVAQHDLAPAPAHPVMVEPARPRPTAVPSPALAHKDPIAELLAGHSVQSSPQPHAPPPLHHAALPAVPPVPPVPIPAPSRSLVQPSRQVLAVQRALSDFGYGQLKPTGLMDEETRAALKQFQGTHNLPATGELNDQVKRELADMVGHDLN